MPIFTKEFLRELNKHPGAPDILSFFLNDLGCGWECAVQCVAEIYCLEPKYIVIKRQTFEEKLKFMQEHSSLSDQELQLLCEKWRKDEAEHSPE